MLIRLEIVREGFAALGRASITNRLLYHGATSARSVRNSIRGKLLSIHP